MAAAEAAQEAAQGAAGAESPAEYIMHHVRDGFDWEVPGSHGLGSHVNTKEVFGDWSANIGGHVVDFTPTKLTIMLWVGAILLLAVLLSSMRNRKQVPKGRLQTTIEMLFLFVRDEIAEKNIGHDGHRYTPFLASAFFFILTLNLLGLVPYGATATGSLSVTVVLALCTFVLTQVAGMRSQGVVGYWSHLVPSGVPFWLYPLLLPIEFIGLFTKPFALMMRLFANMVAGHIVVFFLIGLIFIMKTAAVAPVAVPFAFGIFLLEIFVAFIQAYVFTILSAVFIGLASHAH